jgi:hypothetical protein
MFESFKPAEIYIRPDPSTMKVTGAIAGCLINDPETTLAIPMVDCDIDKHVADAIKVSRLRPDFRSKPVMAVCRGQGGGKTRVLEEMRRELYLVEARCT